MIQFMRETDRQSNVFHVPAKAAHNFVETSFFLITNKHFFKDFEIIAESSLHKVATLVYAFENEINSLPCLPWWCLKSCPQFCTRLLVRAWIRASFHSLGTSLDLAEFPAFLLPPTLLCQQTKPSNTLYLETQWPPEAGNQIGNFHSSFSPPLQFIPSHSQTWTLTFGGYPPTLHRSIPWGLHRIWK